MVNFFNRRSQVTVDENNNEVTTPRRAVSIQKSLVVFLCLGFLGSVAAIGVVATGGSSGNTDVRLETEWAPFLRKPTDIQVQKLREIRELSPFPAPLEGEIRADVCYTVECLDAALALLKAMNTSANPCDDFYDFSCGRWLQDNPIPGTSTRWSQFNVLRIEVNKITQEILDSAPDANDFKPVQQVKDFYKLCIDEDKLDDLGIQPIIDKSNELGSWPAATDSWSPDGFNLLESLADIKRIYQDYIIIRPYVSQDIKNTTRSRIYLDQPGFFLPRSVLLDDSQGATDRKDAYKAYFKMVATVFARETGANVAPGELEEQAADIIAFETELAKIAAKDEDRTNTTRVYNEKGLIKYQEETDAIDVTNPHAKINWKTYLDKVFESAKTKVEPDETIIVLETDYYRNLISLLDKTDVKVIANYVHWRFISGIIPETTREMREIGFAFDKVNSGLQVPVERTTSCANTALNGFGMAIGVPYIKKTGFDESSKKNLNDMVENLRSAFKELLLANTWMDDATKKLAAEKADAINSFMAYPEWLNNKDRLEKEFAGYELAVSYLQSVTDLSTWMGDQSLNTLRDITDKDYWLTYPGVVNAFYSPEFNSITFPAGILQPPFYRIKGPESINYGGIGMVIGHEITHGFDDQGSQYDANGNAEEWWSDDIRKKFTEKAQCIVDQYGRFKTPAGDSVNGDLTSGENIADNGGIRQTYLAYQNWIKNNNGGKEERRLPGLEDFTPDQLFFLGYGNVWCENITPQALANQIRTDPHSPAHFRVLGPLRNSDIFAKAWNCPVGSGMNPPAAQKCILW